MIKPFACGFWELLDALTKAETQLSAVHIGSPVSSEQQSFLWDWMIFAEIQCKEVAMPPGMFLEIGTLKNRIHGNAPASELRQLVWALKRHIHDELMYRMFMFIPISTAAYYNQPELFGSEVGKQFTKAGKDVCEVGNCLAVGCWTASVYHAMCVLEVGLDSLSHALNLPYSQANWNAILNQIEKAIAAMGPHSGANWKQDKEWYSNAAIEFKYFREAWRNHTMHGRAKYQDTDAVKIFEHVRDFMVHLSSRLTERP